MFESTLIQLKKVIGYSNYQQLSNLIDEFFLKQGITANIIPDVD